MAGSRKHTASYCKRGWRQVPPISHLLLSPMGKAQRVSEGGMLRDGERGEQAMTRIGGPSMIARTDLADKGFCILLIITTGPDRCAHVAVPMPQGLHHSGILWVQASVSGHLASSG